jgi:hypothetical protein
MSVDLYATLPRPVSMATVIDTASTTLTELLALAAPPKLCVTGFAVYDHGEIVQPGRRLAAPELRAMTLGVPGEGQHVQVAVGRDPVWLMDGEYHPHGDDGFVLTVSPARTSVGVVLAMSVALAAAMVAGGEFIDDEIRMLRPPERNPRSVVDRTRLRTARPDLATACEEYMRPFPHLGGWPEVVTLD